MQPNGLKLALGILQEINLHNTPSAEDFGVEKLDFCIAVRNLISANLVTGVLTSTTLSDDPRMGTIDLSQAYVTLKGQEYLYDHSAIMSTYKGLKEIREWLPF